MPILGVTIENVPSFQRIRDGLAWKFGYQDMVEDDDGDLIPNPQTKLAFVKENIKRLFKRWALEYELHLEKQASAKPGEIDGIDFT